jgi:serine/threonine protein kinase
MTNDSYPDALPPQYRLHWYVLDRVLGQGGFGITYLARDTNLDQQVAIKEYLPVDVATRRADSTVRPRSDDQADRYRWGLDRFIREARTLARFDHPNVVRVLSVFEQHGTAYMVMRFEEGENFAALLDRKRTVSESELMRVLLPVLDGLELVHNAGFIHRDIKPDNIHIRTDGSPVLLDFGSARHSLGQARTVTILVAPGYAPFEQYYSSGEDQGPWTDLYSLGATCYRAVAGVSPMDAIARSKGVLGSARELLVPAVAVGSGRYSERLLKAIDHALAFAEKDRPATIAAWREELLAPGAAAVARSAAAATQAAPVRPASTASPAAPAMPPTPPPHPVAPAVTSKSPVMRTATVAAGILIVALIGGGIGAYMVTRGAKPPAEPAVPPHAIAPAEASKAAEAKAAVEAEKVRAEKVAAEKAAAEKAAAERAMAERAAAEKTAAEKAAAERATAEKIAGEKAAAQKIAADKAAAEQAAERAARAKAAESRAAAKAEAERQAIATAKTAATVQTAPAPPSGDAAAFTHYSGLAHRGDAAAALTLGGLYESGRGVGASDNWAYLWYSVAERRGAGGARAKKDAVAARLQPKELEQLDRQVRGVVDAPK